MQVDAKEVLFLLVSVHPQADSLTRTHIPDADMHATYSLHTECDYTRHCFMLLH